jgi:hypothetical protein
MCSQAAILGKGELERMVSNEWREGAPHELPSVDLDVVGVGAGVGGAEAALPDFVEARHHAAAGLQPQARSSWATVHSGTMYFRPRTVMGT